MAQPKQDTPPYPDSLAAYEARLASGDLHGDPAQRRVAELLAEFQEKLTERCTQPRGLLNRIFTKHNSAPLAFYLYGDVGRGKTMLMDMFYDCLPSGWQKRRVHFHAFMRDIHSRLHAWRQTHKGEDDLLPRIVADYASDVTILCLDEFQVLDVTDAMILSRLFTLLLAEGVAVVITSNRHPRDLYQGGLQREQFLTFVDLVERDMQIVSLDSSTDYRLQQIASLQSTYMHPLSTQADEFLLDSWRALVGTAPSDELDIDVNGRILKIYKHHKGFAWLTFEELCVRPLGAHDYIELARACHTLFLQNIPRMTPGERNEAKRFVTLIDIVYEHNVKLICTANAPVTELYPSGDGNFEFQRTVSRLIEMQSASYLALDHIG